MKNNSFIKNLKYDFPAGLVVYLVALPLCLGVALASTGRTDLLFSGIIAGAVGGIVVGAISGSRLGVAGPAAGLVTIVLSSIATLGSFEAFLVAVVLAGILQVIAGFLKAGVIGYYFPSAVIKGMLAAIGIILILKQIPHAFGFDEDFIGDEAFMQKDGHNTFTELYYAVRYSSMGAIIISVVSLAILILFDKKLSKFNLFKFLPGALVVVLVGVLLNFIFKQVVPEYFLGGKHIVSLPEPKTASEFIGLIRFPDFSILKNYNVYIIAITIAVVASLESLLSVEATDKLDPDRHSTPTNRELKAQGVGNIVSGLLGGLPVTQVIVRSSANINSGAKSKSSTIIHGIILIITVLAIPAWLNLIPLSSLAMILIFIGYKLSKPSLYKGMFNLGVEQFLPFIITVVAVIATDLLVGIGIGLVFAIYFILKKNYKNSFKYLSEYSGGREKITFRLSEEVTFLNKARIATALDEVPEGATLIIDGSKSKDIHFDVLEKIQEFKDHSAIEKNITIETIGIPEIKDTGNGLKIKVGLKNILKKMRTHTRISQEQMTPETALSYLKEGNNRFVENLRAHRDLLEQVNETAEGQYPFAVVLSCIDSRTSAELIFDQGLGDIFSVRVAGNVVNDDILGSMEYACKVAGSKLVVVLGHSKCGAITSACNHVVMGNITTLLSKIQPAVSKVREELNDVTSDEAVQKVADINVKDSIAHIHQRSSILADMAAAGEIKIVGAMYNLDSGKVEFFED